jgi:hypothetical protein
VTLTIQFEVIQGRKAMRSQENLDLEAHYDSSKKRTEKEAESYIND